MSSPTVLTKGSYVTSKRPPEWSGEAPGITAIVVGGFFIALLGYLAVEIISKVT